MLRRSAVKIVAAVCACAAVGLAVVQGGEPQARKATHIASFEWVPTKALRKSRKFGGFSGFAVTNNGSRFVALSDRSHIVAGRIVRQNGVITEVVPDGPLQRLRSSKGKALSGRVGDSEGLALHPGGGFFVSYEGVSRIAYHSSAAANSVVLPRPAAFSKLPGNKALEALAIDGRGQLYTMPERAFDAEGGIPIYRWNGKVWHQPFSFDPQNGYLPVSADFGPDGRFYVLERDFKLIGFRSRLRRWDVTRDGLKNEVTLVRTGVGRHDNLEGLSVWRDTFGRLRATMISDDNFIGLQRTELVEYMLPD